MSEREANVNVKVHGKGPSLQSFLFGKEGAGGAALSGMQRLTSGIQGLARSTMMLGGLGAGIGLFDQLAKIRDTEQAVGKLTFAVRAGTGRLVDRNVVMKQADEVNRKWLVNTHDLIDAQTRLFDKSGDYDFSTKALEKVAIVSRGAREEIGGLADIAGDLNGNFAIADDQIGGALSGLVSFGHKGGMSVDELGASIKKLGMSAKLAGVQGAEGFERMLGFLTYAEGPSGSGRQAMGVVSDIMSGLETGDLQKKAGMLGVNIKKGTPFEAAIAQIVGAAGGNNDKLKAVFGEQALPVMKALSDVFAEGKKNGGLKGGVDAVVDAFDEASKTVLTFSQMQEEATKRSKESGSRFERAQNNLERVLKSDAVAAALEALAKGIEGITEKLSGLGDSPWVKALKPLAPGTKENATDLLGIGGAALAMGINPALGAVGAVGMAGYEVYQLAKETGQDNGDFTANYVPKADAEYMDMVGGGYQLTKTYRVGTDKAGNALYGRRTKTYDADEIRLEKNWGKNGEAEYAPDTDQSLYKTTAASSKSIRALLAEERARQRPDFVDTRIGPYDPSATLGSGDIATTGPIRLATIGEKNAALNAAEKTALAATAGAIGTMPKATANDQMAAQTEASRESARLLADMLGKLGGQLTIKGDVRVTSLPESKIPGVNPNGG